ncbi:uncharacterized protein LOC125012398 isoform X1 [Mugil cephalus]|uniref:uncharacterized protein LOC125012398 isoform X1 n=1 Tax=Mugil cephalus TaxID=48193 RepID=UPI001FB5F036|nr:uncharacterized protein LOC125012398 isoform X1 [Mugil cephalus]
MNFTLITAFSLCSLCWFSVSGSEFKTMDVQSGQDVTLTCSGKEQHDTVIIWFRVVNRTSFGYIYTVYPSGKVAATSDQFPNGKYETVSDSSSVLLKIKSLDSSDSGLYVCGILRNGNLLLTRTHLTIDGTDEFHCNMDNKRKSADQSDGNMDSKCKQADEMVKLVSVALDGLTVILVMVIIGVVFQNLMLTKKLKKAQEERNPEQSQKHGSDDLNYAAVTFQKREKKRRTRAKCYLCCYQIDWELCCIVFTLCFVALDGLLV